MPVVLLHGGPGGSSFCLKAFEELGSDRQVIRYDQLGSGKSDMVSDTTFYKVERFVEELDLLRTALGIGKWHILGHSWGTVIALEYYHSYPERVASLVFGSPCFDMPDWEKSTQQLLATLPDSLRDAVIRAEETGVYDEPLYKKAMELFYVKYVWGPNAGLPDYDSLLSTFNVGMYHFMWGPSEFSVTGSLKGYNGTPYLSGIKVPALFTSGEFDEIKPDFVKEYAARVPGAEYVMFPGSSHMTPWDAREESIRTVRDFLNSAE